MLIVVGFEDNVSSVTHQITFDKSSQEAIVSIVEMIDHDFLKIGYMKQAPRFKAGSLDSTQIAWYSDHDNNGSIDSISYYLGDIQTASTTTNPNIRKLYRKINNGNPLEVSWGIVHFNLTYYDSSMAQLNYGQINNLSVLNKIRGIKVELRVESQYKYSENYGSTYWEKTYFPRNLAL